MQYKIIAKLFLKNDIIRQKKYTNERKNITMILMLLKYQVNFLEIKL